MYKRLTLTDHMMLLKAQTDFPGGFRENFFENSKRISAVIPRFFAYSTVDNLLEETHV